MKRGFEVTLFSYERITNLPDGVIAADANEILPRAFTQRVIYNGRPDLAHFSDLFRYQMIRSRDLVWIDMDILMISKDESLPYPDVIVKEEQGGINGAVLYFSSKSMREEVWRLAESKLDKSLRWGETGPEIIKTAVRAQATPPPMYKHAVFYPVEHYDIWKLLLPRHCDECEEKCSKSLTIHLFNNILTTMGYWKEIAPPEGSYLFKILARDGLLPYFSGIYPHPVMTSVVENFLYRQNGRALGVKTVLRELLPSVARTYRHYRK